MVYNNLNELLDAYYDWYVQQPDPAESEEMGEWSRLFKVYSEARKNPPPGVIGVGIITYAEQKLQEAQQ